MSLKLGVDFCVINNPFSYGVGNEYIIFFTKKGSETLDPSLRKEDVYNDIVLFLKEKGYLEISDCRFEYIDNNINVESYRKSQLVKMLQDQGCFYNYDLEENINTEFQEMAEDMDIDEDTLKEVFDSIREEDNKNNTRKPFWLDSEGSINSKNNLSLLSKEKKEEMLEEIKGKISFPKKGSKINVNLYLFLQFVYVENRGDFDVDFLASLSNESLIDPCARYIKVINSDFECISDDKGRLVFKSKKKKGDLLKEISFLYDGFFDLIKITDFSMQEKSSIKTDRIFFTMMDIKDRIKEEDYIYIDIEKNEDEFAEMCLISNEIRKDEKKQNQNKILLDDVEEMAIDALDTLEDKMLKYSEEEEYLKAAQVKKEIDYINKKIEDLFDEKTDQDEMNFNEFHSLLPVKE